MRSLFVSYSCPESRFIHTFSLDSTFHLCGIPFFTFHLCVLIYSICFSLWLTSLCMTYSGFIFITTGDPISFFNGCVIFHCIYVSQFPYPFICWWCFHVLAIANCTAVNIGVHVLFWIMAFSVHMWNHEIIKSYGGSVCGFLRILHTVVLTGCISLRFQQQL